jgi:hypothetical protein
VIPLALSGTFACSSYQTMVDVPVDCSIESDYEIGVLDAAETLGQVNWWGSGDDSPGKIVEVDVQPIEGEGRCGSKAATVLRTAHNNDWGSLFGYNNFGPADKSAYDGMSFWARSPGNTSKGFTILLDDLNTAATTGSNCVDYGTSSSSDQTGQITGPNGETISTSGSASFAGYPEQCGNSYTTTMSVTGEWAFYTIPFSQFQQAATPNRVPNAFLTEVGPSPGTALLTNKLVNLIIRMPKEANIELWLDNLAFYRLKAN